MRRMKNYWPYKQIEYIYNGSYLYSLVGTYRQYFFRGISKGGINGANFHITNYEKVGKISK